MDDNKPKFQEGLLEPLWESSAHAPNPEPPRPHRWSWQEVRKHLLQAAKLTSPDVVERRVLRLMNPEPVSSTDESTVGNLAVAIQVLLPGEKARPHRHSINALRFILEGTGATTIVNGIPVEMRPGDMLLTPGTCWHEHEHEGDKMSIWVDILDAPVHDKLGVTSFQPGPPAESEVPNMAPAAAFRSPAILPVGIEYDSAYSPVFRYPYQDVLNVLDHAPVGPAGTRSIRYSNPMTGGAAMSTIDIHMVGVELGATGKDYRCNADFIFLVVDGEGETLVNGESISWNRFDIVTIPRNNWFRHVASSKANLLQVSDSEMLRRLNLFNESFRTQ